MARGILTDEQKVAKALRRLEREGVKFEAVVAEFRKTGSLQQVAKAFGWASARFLSDLRPLLGPSPATPHMDMEDPSEVPPDMPVTRAGKQSETALRVTAMQKARDIITVKLPLERRIAHWTKLARSAESEQVRLKALERIDDLMGLIPSKMPHEPDPPPMFALPANSEPDIMEFEEWVKDHPNVLARVQGGMGVGGRGGTGGEPGGGGGEVN